MQFPKPMDLNHSMHRFRLASRELFNNFFAVPLPPANYDYEYYDGFNNVENVLFQSLVLDPCIVPYSEDFAYGVKMHPHIRVRLPSAELDRDLVGGPIEIAPIMINREIDSGYWDHDVSKVDNSAIMKFVCFFDWESMHSRDNAFVRVQITDWPQHTDLIGKHALIESTMVRFSLISDKS